MEREEYISLIEGLNGYCDCKELSKLTKLISEGEHLRNLCDAFSDKVNKSEEEEIYTGRLSDLILCSIQHGKEAGNLLEEEKLILYYYNEKDNYKKEKINLEKAKDLIKKDKVITLNCYSCDQQIDLVHNFEFQ